MGSRRTRSSRRDRIVALSTRRRSLVHDVPCGFFAPCQSEDKLIVAPHCTNTDEPCAIRHGFGLAHVRDLPPNHIQSFRITLFVIPLGHSSGGTSDGTLHNTSIVHPFRRAGHNKPLMWLLERTRPDAPVVVFTSSANPHFRQRALELGARDYVQKPSTSQSIDRLYRRWCSGGLGRKVTSRPQRSSMGSPSRYEYERHDFWKQPSATATEVFRTSRRW